MNSYLIVDGEDMSYLWNTVQQQQIVFHPDISPAGKIDTQKFFQSKAKKPYILFLDRNILSSLLKFCEKGSLKNKGESQLIGIIMAWAEMNGISISAGFAVREYAAQLHSQEAGLIELQKFKEIFETYPGQMWLEVAEGQRTEIPPITYSQKPANNITVDYADAGDHYDMAVASLLCAVRLYRNNNLSCRSVGGPIRMVTSAVLQRSWRRMCTLPIPRASLEKARRIPVGSRLLRIRRRATHLLQVSLHPWMTRMHSCRSKRICLWKKPSAGMSILEDVMFAERKAS